MISSIRGKKTLFFFTCISILSSSWTFDDSTGKNVHQLGYDDTRNLKISVDTFIVPVITFSPVAAQLPDTYII